MSDPKEVVEALEYLADYRGDLSKPLSDAIATITKLEEDREERIEEWMRLLSDSMEHVTELQTTITELREFIERIAMDDAFDNYWFSDANEMLTQIAAHEGQPDASYFPPKEKT